MNIYLTADKIGMPTGAGAVTHHEYTALSTLGETRFIDGSSVPFSGDPFASDEEFLKLVRPMGGVKRVHLYAGCFTNTVRFLKGQGAKVTYTAAAHDISESRKEFEGLGIPFDFPHLTNPELWEKYVGGYKDADVVVCPSTLSKKVMESYGCKNVVVIPHGCGIPETVTPQPKTFHVGYLGAVGPDKGLRYLFEAWKTMNLKDATLLIGGDNIDQALPIWRRFGGGNVEFMGWVKDVSEFYNQITLLVQPSVSEGYGIEVLEAMAHARPVVCSTGVGAADAVVDGAGLIVPSRDPVKIAEAIGIYRAKPGKVASDGAYARENAKAFRWESIREKYQSFWRSL